MENDYVLLLLDGKVICSCPVERNTIIAHRRRRQMFPRSLGDKAALVARHVVKSAVLSLWRHGGIMKGAWPRRVGRRRHFHRHSAVRKNRKDANKFVTFAIPTGLARSEPDGYSRARRNRGVSRQVRNAFRDGVRAKNRQALIPIAAWKLGEGIHQLDDAGRSGPRKRSNWLKPRWNEPPESRNPGLGGRSGSRVSLFCL